MEGLFSDYEAIRKSGLFDPEHYATAYPDVAERNVDPLVHYLEEGAREGRDPHPDFDTAFYLEQCRARGEEPANPLLHYLLIGAARGFQIKRDGKSPEVTEAPGIAAKPQILVAVESLGVAGTAEGRSRLSINGWALAAAPISEITAAIGGVVVGRATYGLPRPDNGRLYPGHCGKQKLAVSLKPAEMKGFLKPAGCKNMVQTHEASQPDEVPVHSRKLPRQRPGLRPGTGERRRATAPDRQKESTP